MKRLCALFLALTLLLGAVSCAAEVTEPEPAPAHEAEMQKEEKEPMEPVELTANVQSEPHDWSPEGADYTALGKLGLALLRAAEGENPVLSPLSAYIALSMAADGADGETLRAFEAVLSADRHREMSLLLTKLEEEDNTFSAANSAWVSRRAIIRPEYLQALADFYAAEAFATDFAIEPMNAWVEEHTNGLIQKLFSEPLDPDTRLVLINTLYMKAKWAHAFKKEHTWSELFHAETGDTEAEFMHNTAWYDYLSGEGYEGIILPYRGGGVNFIALKPTEGTAQSLLEALDTTRFSGESRKIRLTLPKFETEFSMKLNEPLMTLGLSAAFDPDKADFSRMSEEPLFIGQVRQKVKVIVDEEGTEAAAATVVEMRATSAAPGFEEPPYELRFDEPFVYLITEAESGAPLFLGILENPAG